MISVLNQDTKEVAGFPDDTSTDEINDAFAGRKYGQITASPPPSMMEKAGTAISSFVEDKAPSFYDNYFKPFVSKLNTNELNSNYLVPEDPSDWRRTFTSNFANSATFNIMKANDQTQLNAQHPVAALAGQLSGMALPFGAINAGIKAIRFPAMIARMIQPLEVLAKANPEAAPLIETAYKAIMGGTQAGVAMGTYRGVSETANELNTQDHLDLIKIGEGVAKDTGLGFIAGGLGGAVSRELEGLGLGEKVGQIAKEAAVSGGTWYTVARLSGASHNDALLQAAGMMVQHVTSVLGNTPESRTFNRETTKNLIKGYLKAEKPDLSDSIVERTAEEFLQNLENPPKEPAQPGERITAEPLTKEESDRFDQLDQRAPKEPQQGVYPDVDWNTDNTQEPSDVRTYSINAGEPIKGNYERDYLDKLNKANDLATTLDSLRKRGMVNEVAETERQVKQLLDEAEQLRKDNEASKLTEPGTEPKKAYKEVTDENNVVRRVPINTMGPLEKGTILTNDTGEVPAKPDENQGSFTKQEADEYEALKAKKEAHDAEPVYIQRIRAIADKLGVKVGNIIISNKSVKLEWSDPMDRAVLEQAGYTKEDYDNAIRNNDPPYATGTHQLITDDTGTKRSEITLFAGHSALDAFHEFAHAVEEQGGLPGWHGTKEQHASYIEKLFNEGKENQLVEMTPEGSRVGYGGEGKIGILNAVRRETDLKGEQGIKQAYRVAFEIDGKVYEGKPGEIHAQLLDRLPKDIQNRYHELLNDPDKAGFLSGFVSKEDGFQTRGDIEMRTGKVPNVEIVNEGFNKNPPTAKGGEIEYLYHNSSQRHLEGIANEGIRKDLAGEYPHGIKDISDEKLRIYLAEDKNRALSFGGMTNSKYPETRSMLMRVKPSALKGDVYKPTNLGKGGGGETWFFGDKINPEDIEVRVGGDEWIPIRDYAEQQGIKLSKLSTPTGEDNGQDILHSVRRQSELNPDTMFRERIADAITGTARMEPKEKSEEITPENIIGKQEAGEEGASGIAKSIKAKDAAEGLATEFPELAKYRKTTFEEQGKLIEDFIKSGEDNMRAIINGEKPLPAHMEPVSAIWGMEQYLKQNPNSDLKAELANSPLISETSEQARGLSIARMRSADSATKKIGELREALRESRGKEGGKERIKVEKEMTSESKKINLDKEEMKWDNFLESIKC